MDYRKNMNTPREMVDDAFLLRLMREAEPAVSSFGNNARRQPHRRNSGGCREAEHRPCGHPEVSCRKAPEHHSEPECGCRQEQNNPVGDCARHECLSSYPLAMAYVPVQEWEHLYEEEKALERGTMFESLDLPWYPSACGGIRVGKCGDSRRKGD